MDNPDRCLVLVGGGGHCKSVLDAAEQMDIFKNIVITDPDLRPGSTVLGHTVVGSDEALDELYHKGYTDAFITVGSIKSTMIRRKIFQRLKSVGFDFPNIIDPTAVVSHRASLGKGIFIGKNAVVNSDTRIDDFAIINTSAVVEHECKVGEFTHIAVGAKICGQVEIGKDSFVGAGSIVIQDIKIGDNVIVGAGSLVRHNVRNCQKIFGGGLNWPKKTVPFYSFRCEWIGGAA